MRGAAEFRLRRLRAGSSAPSKRGATSKNNTPQSHQAFLRALTKHIWLSFSNEINENKVHLHSFFYNIACFVQSSMPGNILSQILLIFSSLIESTRKIELTYKLRMAVMKNGKKSSRKRLLFLLWRFLRNISIGKYFSLVLEWNRFFINYFWIRKHWLYNLNDITIVS